MFQVCNFQKMSLAALSDFGLFLKKSFLQVCNGFIVTFTNKTLE